MVEVNDRFLRACRRQPSDCTPVWLMRQAGRYMPAYRAVREKYGFLQMVKTPELAAQITLQPVHAFAVDAAIIFADILPVLEGMGMKLTYEQGEGPVIHNSIKSPNDVAGLAASDPRETVGYTLDAIRLVKRELGGRLPLIGFSGAPFTLAAYAIEGGGSKDYRRVKQFMLAEPAAWHALMTKLTDLVSAYLIAQIEAGADAVQIFDSWAGVLSPFDYAESVLPYVRRIVEKVSEVSLVSHGVERSQSDVPKSQISRDPRSSLDPDSKARNRAEGSGDSRNENRDRGVNRKYPIIYFGTDMSGMGVALSETGADVIGVDWRINLDAAWAQLGDTAVQGNLDPAVLFAPWPEVERRARDVLDRAAGRPGHIFNLGHGIMPETPVETVKRLVDYVHDYSRRDINEVMPMAETAEARIA